MDTQNNKENTETFDENEDESFNRIPFNETRLKLKKNNYTTRPRIR